MPTVQLSGTDLQKPSHDCPHPDLPQIQQCAITKFKADTSAAFMTCQQKVNPGAIFAVTLDIAATRLLDSYGPLPEPIASNRDPQSLMAQALKHVTHMNKQLYTISSQEEAEIDILRVALKKAYDECILTVAPNVLLALSIEYSARLNYEYWQAMGVPDDNPQKLMAYVLANVANLNRQPHVKHI